MAVGLRSVKLGYQRPRLSADEGRKSLDDSDWMGVARDRLLFCLISHFGQDFVFDLFKCNY